VTQRPGVSSDIYSESYFLTECEGHESYKETGGRQLPRRLVTAVDLAHDLLSDPAFEGAAVLDLGCGRGELVRYLSEASQMSVGLDYSIDALRLARDILPANGAGLAQANVLHLPFADETFQLVFALDLVEHLYPEELDATLREVGRVLKPGGRLIVHTMPNIWYYRYGYPLFRLVQRLRGNVLPADPRDRYKYVKHVHVNEQSVRSLSKSLRRAGFGARVSLRNTQTWDRESSALARRVYHLLSAAYPFAWIFCSDIFAVATKQLA